MDLSEIEAKTDALLAQLVATDTGAAAARDICWRLEGLQAAAQIKATVAYRKCSLDFCGMRGPRLIDTGTFFVEVPRCKEKYEPEQDREALTHTCDLYARPGGR